MDTTTCNLFVFFYVSVIKNKGESDEKVLRSCSFTLLVGQASMATDTFSHCDSLIQHGINNITRYKSADHTLVYKWYSSCGMDFQSASDSSIKKASVSIFGYGSGETGGNSAQQRQKLKEWCTDNKSFAMKNKDLYEEASAVSEAALQAWNQCQNIASKGVFISANPSGDHSDFVHFEIDSTLDADLRLYEITEHNYDCTTLLSAKEGENKGILMGYNPKQQPLIRNSNIHINCIRQAPQVTTDEGVVKSKYQQAYVSIQTSGPSLQFYEPEVVDDYITTPKGSVIAFASNKCPNGWNEYKEAYGRFVRGLDKSGQGIDPQQNRQISSLQNDIFKAHTHGVTDHGHTHNMGGYAQSGNIYDSGGGRSAWAYYSAPNKQVSMSHANVSIQNSGGAETRPKNVALLYCIKN